MFEEQAIATAPDDIFTILDRGSFDCFLQHLNSQQPYIRFTMETENDNKIAFFDASVTREPDGPFTTSVYRKPTHTDQYIVDSNHPKSVKRGTAVKCLYHSRRPVRQRTTEGTTSPRTAEGTISTRGNEKDRNPPITADHRATNGDA